MILLCSCLVVLLDQNHRHVPNLDIQKLMIMNHDDLPNVRDPRYAQLDSLPALCCPLALHIGYQVDSRRRQFRSEHNGMLDRQLNDSGLKVCARIKFEVSYVARRNAHSINISIRHHVLLFLDAVNGFNAYYPHAHACNSCRIPEKAKASGSWSGIDGTERASEWHLCTCPAP